MPPGRPPKEAAPRKPNPLRNRPPIQAPLPPLFQQKQAAAAAAAVKAAPRPARRACPNKTCSAPDVVDGICHNCGTIVDDSNIVSEVQFGESSNGAAVVQGSFVSADQGTAKSLGPAFRRAGGMEDREGTIREGRRIMQALGYQLGIPESTIMSGVQIFKLAANNNFIQGRRMDMVAAVCLYSAARKESPCRVMLIDFADRLQINVFKLGRTFKDLHRTITLSADGIMPVLPEDLIYRFADKLEFGELKDKVSEDAIRMVQRMSMDWMVQGRRPSGVCGACLILAARMNNFRRTITEVVYIVKVTTHTIQKRLDEFKVTPSSALTVDEFLNNEFLEAAHDPPSFYEKTEEWQKNKKKRRRRKVHDYRDGSDEEDNENSGSNEEGDEGRNKRQKTAEATPHPDQPVQSVELRRDADGFAIPPQPIQSHDIPIDPDLVDEAIADQTSTTFDKLVAQFGDIPDTASNPDEEAADDDDASSNTSGPKRRGRRPARAIHVPDEWAAMEDRLENEISEVINDPNTIYHAAHYAKAKKRAAAHMLTAENDNPSRNISMDVHIGEDEFADDPEVVSCVLPEEEVKKKEKVWVNANRDWLRKQQMKLWAKKQAENGPPKAKRNRKRKPRIGEGQTSAASSPAEAAINVMKERAFSKKINYSAIADIFKGISNLRNGPELELGSAGTSRVTSRAGSDLGDSAEGSSRASSLAPSVADSVASNNSTSSNFLRLPKDRYERYEQRKKIRDAKKPASIIGSPAGSSPAPGPSARVRSPAEEEGDDDDYVRPSPTPTPRTRPQEPEEDTDDWRTQVRNAGQIGGVEDEEELLEDEEEYEDYGGVDAGGIPDDVSDRGFDMDDDDGGFGDDD